jgi:hypothetical protein
VPTLGSLSGRGLCCLGRVQFGNADLVALGPARITQPNSGRRSLTTVWVQVTGFRLVGAAGHGT